MWWITGLALIGLSAGILSGIFGIGGGILVIPALIFFYGMEQKLAQGTTLLMMVPPIGLLAALEYLKRGQANWQAALWICLGFVVGGYLGSKWVGAVPSLYLKKTFALLMIGVGIRMFFK